MSDSGYELTKVCSRAGKEYYHIRQKREIDLKQLHIDQTKIMFSHPEFLVIAFHDCCVTVFRSGRMLIENLPADSEKRARAIVEKILS